MWVALGLWDFGSERVTAIILICHYSTPLIRIEIRQIVCPTPSWLI